MTDTAQQAYDKIVAHMDDQISKNGGGYPNWYCGITSNIEGRLFGYHQVPRQNYWRIFCDCISAEAARNVEGGLLGLGCDGGTGGGDEQSIYVYAYLKSAITNP